MSRSESPINNVRASVADMDVNRIGKRNRPPKSCEPCRIRKLKCNREKPCDSCTKRGKEAVCDYAPNADRSKTDHGSRQVKPSDRLQRLEDLVLQFMENGVSQSPTSSSGTGKSTTSPDSSIPARQSTDGYRSSISGSDDYHSSKPEANFNDTNGLLENGVGGETNYVDSSHWLSILNEIKEVREHLPAAPATVARENLPENESGADTSVDLAFGAVQPTRLLDILRSVPPREVCDSLLSYYFNTQYMIMPIVHPGKFQREYEIFWKDPPKAPVLWVGLLFAILALAATLRQTSPALHSLGGSVVATKTFQQKTAQCLILGKYSNPKAYGVEAMMLHLQSSYMASEDSSINTWVLMGILVRLAMKMGTHRDARHYPNISAFDGEMRRRVWQTIFQLDILVSFQMGLPSMIQPRDCDTLPPGNFLWTDFNEDTAVLPPSRPLTETTPTTYVIVKCRAMAVFKRIAAATSSLEPVPYEEIMDLDKEARDCYDIVTPDLRMKPMSRSITDAPATIMNRLNIKLLFLKGICVLHRKYLNQDRLNPRYSYSRQACIDAAMDILELQADVNKSSLPGGQLYEDRWMLSSLTAHDFLLAAMVVSLDLSESLRITSPEQLSIGPLSLTDSHNTKLGALEISQRIWAQSIGKSKDASTAAEALALMVKKVNVSAWRSPSSQLDQASQNTTVINGQQVPGEDTRLRFETDLPYAVPMAEMIDVPENLDWAQLDQYFLNPNLFEPLDHYAEHTDFVY